MRLCVKLLENVFKMSGNIMESHRKRVKMFGNIINENAWKFLEMYRNVMEMFKNLMEMCVNVMECVKIMSWICVKNVMEMFGNVMKMSESMWNMCGIVMKILGNIS